MEEYDVVLDTQESSILLQYPLSTELPTLHNIKTKNEDRFAETVGETGAGLNNYRASGSTTINKYYILSVGKDITGVSVKTIFQLRPFLTETEDILKKSEKKETKIFSMNETQEELENRMKNPNYVVEKFRKMPWKEYSVVSGVEETVHLLEQRLLMEENHKKTSAKYSHRKEPSISIDRIRETIYNARVVNIDQLRRIYPTASTLDIKQALSEMTVEVLNRYVLKPEYFGDLESVLINVLNRMKSAQGVLTLTKEEIINSAEGFSYVLSQISHKEKHYYRLKGYFE